MDYSTQIIRCIYKVPVEYFSGGNSSRQSDLDHLKAQGLSFTLAHTHALRLHTLCTYTSASRRPRQTNDSSRIQIPKKSLFCVRVRVRVCCVRVIEHRFAGQIVPCNKIYIRSRFGPVSLTRWNRHWVRAAVHWANIHFRVPTARTTSVAATAECVVRKEQTRNDYERINTRMQPKSQRDTENVVVQCWNGAERLDTQAT